MSKTSLHASSIKDAVRKCEALRKDKIAPLDISLQDYVKNTWGMSMEAFYEDININPAVDTIHNLMNMPDDNFKWLVPEIIRDALRLGLRKAPIYSNLIAAEQSVSGLTVVMPAINMSDAAPKKVGVAETIQVGEVSFDQKSVGIHKIGRGVKLPYEVSQYVALNLVSVFLEDFGVKMGMGIDTLALHTLINGDQADGSDSCATIGVINTGNGVVYKDLLKAFVRLARLGKTPTIMVGGEDMSIDVLDMLSTTTVVGNNRMAVDIKTPIPQKADLFVHGKIPTNKIMLIDPSAALVKLNAQPLLVETDKIIQNQTTETYATITTGFATVMRDARVMVDKSVTIGASPFPSWMDPTAHEILDFE